MPTFDSEFMAALGKVVMAALLFMGGAWGVLKVYLRNAKVDDARANVDANSFSAYDATIQMLRNDIASIRADKEQADVLWRQNMAQLESRLQAVSAQATEAIARAKHAESIADQLRNQIRSVHLEPCA
jgi:hypothetical protein